MTRDWDGTVVVAATGPSLTPEVAQKIRKARWPAKKCRVVVVNDAYRAIPFADALYACDLHWWQIHAQDVKNTFHGERWTTHEPPGGSSSNDKSSMPQDWGVRCVLGRELHGFSVDPKVLHYGGNSGFQAVNFALLRGAQRVLLVGFDLRAVGGKRHFFGDHPEPLHNNDNFQRFAVPFRHAARTCGVPILNCTPGSALDAFPMAKLDDELERTNDLLHSHGSVGDGGPSRDRAA